MTLIKTHNKKRFNNKNEKTELKETEKELYILEEIVEQLILEQSNLIYLVDKGRDKNILKIEIEKLVDKSNIYTLDRNKLIKKINDRIFGYGIIQDLIKDEDISDINFNRYNYCSIIKNGEKIITNLSFPNEKAFNIFAKLIIIRNGGVINENQTHRREADEENRLRINVSIPPRNTTGTSIKIRKHRFKNYTLEDLIDLKMLDEKQKKLLLNELHNDKNILIVGKGGSGKTTLLRSLLMKASKYKDFLVCEKDSELYLNDYNNFVIQKIKKQEDGGNEVNLEDLVKDGLTMSLDGFVVGEIIGKECLDFLEAGCTDHNIFGTLHSNGIEETIRRLTLLIHKSDSKLSEETIKQIIADSLSLIIYIKDFKIEKIAKIKEYNFNIKEIIFDFID